VLCKCNSSVRVGSAECSGSVLVSSAEYSGSVLVGSAECSGSVLVSSAEYSGSVFVSSAECSGSVLVSSAEYSGSVFVSSAECSGSVLVGSADLTRGLSTFGLELKHKAGVQHKPTKQQAISAFAKCFTRAGDAPCWPWITFLPVGMVTTFCRISVVMFAHDTSTSSTCDSLRAEYVERLEQYAGGVPP
jgi:hypothetical protein